MGHGQEDIYPVAQMEKLWSHMPALPDVPCGYIDSWVTDGRKDYVASLVAGCYFTIDRLVSSLSRT